MRLRWVASVASWWCTYTTKQVLVAPRAVSERQPLDELFDQVPSFMAIVRGPTHPVRAGQPELHASDRKETFQVEIGKSVQTVL